MNTLGVEQVQRANRHPETFLNEQADVVESLAQVVGMGHNLTDLLQGEEKVVVIAGWHWGHRYRGVE
jgi:hypothetical protein